MTSNTDHQAFGDDQLPPHWCLVRPKPHWQSAWDLLGAPLRMVALPDVTSERIHLTSLRGERFAAVLPVVQGRLLDIGAGDNALVRMYRQSGQPEAQHSIGVDIEDWGAGCTLIQTSDELPFPDASFDTIAYIACLNHIPERQEALVEAQRLLRPGGRVVITMIGRFIGTVGHRLWWYSEDKHRHVDEEEEMGLAAQDVHKLLAAAGFTQVRESGFVYGLNRLFVAEKQSSPLSTES